MKNCVLCPYWLLLPFQVFLGSVQDHAGLYYTPISCHVPTVSPFLINKWSYCYAGLYVMNEGESEMNQACSMPSRDSQVAEQG